MDYATIKVEAFLHDKIMQDHLGMDISETITCSTNIPSDALGEVTTRCLNRAWSQGIDPALSGGFHLVTTFA